MVTYKHGVCTYLIYVSCKTYIGVQSRYDCVTNIPCDFHTYHAHHCVPHTVNCCAEVKKKIASSNTVVSVT